MNIIEQLKKTFPVDDEGFTMLFQLLELPDEQFKIAYPAIEDELDRLFNSDNNEWDAAVRSAIKTNNTTKEEIEKSKFIVKTIEEDPTLSLNKKQFLIMLFNSTFEKIEEILKQPNEQIMIKIEKTHPDAILPSYANIGDAGADIYAVEDISIAPKTTVIVPTGLKVAIPIGYEIQIRSRSGLAAKTKIRVSNGVGTIDSQFRGEIGVIFDNIGTQIYEIKKGDRIAQMVLNQVPTIKWTEVESLDETERGEGFGSSGK